MNRPLNRYDSAGWLCQYASRLRSRSGRRRNGESAGVAPPSTKWLPPPVPVWRPSIMNFSVVSRLWRAASYRCVVRSTSSSQPADGWMFTSMTPGIRRHAEAVEARVARRLVTFEHHRRGQLAGRGLDRGHQLQVVLEPAGGRHEYIKSAVARLGAQRRAGDPVRGLSGSRSRNIHRLRRLVAARHALHALEMRTSLGATRQRHRRRHRVRLVHVGIVALGHPGLGIQRQAIAHRRVAGDQVATLAPQEPRPGLPLLVLARDGQHVADHRIQALLEHARQPRPLQRIFEF